MNILLDGITIFLKFYKEILVFFVVVLGIGFLGIKHTILYQLNSKIKLLAAFSVGSAVLCVATYVLVILSYFWPFLMQPGSYIILFFSVLVLVREAWLSDIKGIFYPYIVFGVVILLLLLFIRLAFLKHIILPPYSDSPVHYQIISNLLHPGRLNSSKLSLDNLLNNYYHFGFHSLVAWLISITNINPADTISLLGQLFLVIGPISILVFVYTLTNNIIGALFAGLLAAIGWHMPSFAANWGKYPAIAALAVMPSVLALLIFDINITSLKKTYFLQGILILIGIALMHTRVIICLLLSVICFLLSNKLKIENELKITQRIGYSLLYIVSLWPLLKILADFYSGILVLVLSLVLLPFAFKVFPRLSVSIFLYTFGAWLITTVPTLFPNIYRPLLDKQFLEMMLYIPFSIISGAGLAGLTNKLPANGTLRWSVIVSFFAIVIVNFIQINSLYPDSCCNYFSKDDRLAFEWIQEGTSEKTLVLISTSDSAGQRIGTDAGIWLFPLIGQPTNKLPYNIKWDSSNEIEKICRLGTIEIMIYVGGKQYSFDDSQLSNEKWARLAFRSGKTKIYQVSECQN